jgi:hypothetical protein
MMENARELTATQKIDSLIASVTDWRGDKLRTIRAVIQQACPTIEEEWKWETPVWSYKGNVMAAGIFKDHVKLNFFKGALLSQYAGSFNAGLDAKKTRAIDFFEQDSIDKPLLRDLLLAAVDLNTPQKKG